MRMRIIFIGLAALAAGCSQPLPSRALVDDLRILAVRAEPPEAAPGETVTFEGLVADPAGEGRSIRRAWAICTPGDAGVATCGDPSRVTVLGTSDTATWVVPSVALAGLSFDEAIQGRDVYVVLGVEPSEAPQNDHDAPHDVAFKRVRVSTNPAPNQNPAIDSLTIAGLSSGAAIDVDPGVALEVEATAATGSAEVWSAPNGTSGTEDIRYSWSITLGHVSDPVSWGDPSSGYTQNRWSLPASTDDSTLATLWVVLRDGRGGTAWATQPVMVHRGTASPLLAAP